MFKDLQGNLDRMGEQTGNVNKEMETIKNQIEIQVVKITIAYFNRWA